MTTIAVTVTTEGMLNQAKQMAAQLGLPYVHDLKSTAYDYLLVLTPNYLGVQRTRDKRFAPFYIDFLSGKMRYRSEQAGLRSELLARALGVKPSDKPIIIDATAGLGRDSYILATLGFSVIMLEKSPILHLLLQNGLQRAEILNKPVASRLTLHHADAIYWLKEHSSTARPDIVYLDPMFPQRQKAAFVKKEMLTLQELLPKDDKDIELLEAALACAKQRIVVKRPRLAANIGDFAPNFVYTGKTSRFDIYLAKNKVR